MVCIGVLQHGVADKESGHLDTVGVDHTKPMTCDWHILKPYESYPDLRIYLNCGRLGDSKLAPEGLVASCFSVHRCPEGSWYQLMVSGFPWVPQTFTQSDRTDITWYNSICRNLHRKGETEKKKQSILNSPARNLAMGGPGFCTSKDTSRWSY